MASTEFGEDSDSRGGMWVLEQRIDQPMDEEGERLKNMYREKVWCKSPFTWFLLMDSVFFGIWKDIMLAREFGV